MLGQIISDQHLEFRKDNADNLIRIFKLEDRTAEVGIIAGDLIPAYIGEDTVVREFKKFASHYSLLLYCPGNHDYYGHVPKSEVDDLFNRLEREIPNLHIFREGKEVIEYKGQGFIGSMMGYKNSPALRHAWNLIADTGQIDNVSWIYDHCANFEAFLYKNLKSTDIVITHHLPSNESTPSVWQDSPTQPFFVHDMRDLIVNRQPRLWIHGHTHTYCDYRIGNTRVFCNPVGYPSENVNLEPIRTKSIVELDRYHWCNSCGEYKVFSEMNWQRGFCIECVDKLEHKANGLKESGK